MIHVPCKSASCCSDSPQHKQRGTLPVSTVRGTVPKTGYWALSEPGPPYFSWMSIHGCMWDNHTTRLVEVYGRIVRVLFLIGPYISCLISIYNPRFAMPSHASSGSSLRFKSTCYVPRLCDSRYINPHHLIGKGFCMSGGYIPPPPGPCPLPFSMVYTVMCLASRGSTDRHVDTEVNPVMYRHATTDVLNQEHVAKEPHVACIRNHHYQVPAEAWPA
jgi:hypothetical protein